MKRSRTVPIVLGFLFVLLPTLVLACSTWAEVRKWMVSDDAVFANVRLFSDCRSSSGCLVDITLLVTYDDDGDQLVTRVRGSTRVARGRNMKSVRVTGLVPLDVRVIDVMVEDASCY